MAIPLSYNIRNLLVRRFSTLSASGGISMVVAVFILSLALAEGVSFAVKATGSPENVLVLRAGSETEMTSGIELDQASSIAVRPEIGKDEKGQPLFVKEGLFAVLMPRSTNGTMAQVVVRGTEPNAIEVRPSVKIQEGGRMFRSGLTEVIVGRSMAGRIKGMSLGGSIRFENRDWTVVGIFETGGNGFESEVWGDMSILQTAFADREGVFQSLTFRLAYPTGFDALKREIEKDPKYKVKLQKESQYYADQSGMLSGMIAIMGTLITIIMSAGAMFGAMNTMYAAVGTRAREIATLRALGFGRFSILASFLLESLVLAGLGGVIGCLLVLPLNGVTTSAMNWDTFSELAFAFRVTPGLLLAGLIFALVLGLAGGLLPALRAARLPITTGLRQA